MGKVARAILVLGLFVSLNLYFFFALGLSVAAVLLVPLAVLGLKSLFIGSEFNLILYVKHGSTYTWWYNMTRERDFVPALAEKERERYFSGKGPSLTKLKKRYRALPQPDESSGQ